MTAAATASTSLVPVQPVFTDAERLARAGYLAGYRGVTREAYTLDLQQFSGWCRGRSLPLFSSAARASRPSPAISKLKAGPAPPSPAGCPPSPGSTSTLWRRELLGALLVAAGLGPAAEHALMTLLALNGLRVSEATGADIEHLGLEPGHRTLVITRKGGKAVTIQPARAINLAIGERAAGPLFLAAGGRRLDRHGAARIVRRVTRRAAITKQVSPHTLRHAFTTAALDGGMPLRDVQEAASHGDPRTTMRYDRARTSLDRRATYIAAT
jgi:integrase/recombinase XerD